MVQFGEKGVDGAIVEISLVLGLEFDIVEVGLHVGKDQLLLGLAVVFLGIFIYEYFDEVIQQTL